MVLLNEDIGSIVDMSILFGAFLVLVFIIIGVIKLKNKTTISKAILIIIGSVAVFLLAIYIFINFIIGYL